MTAIAELDPLFVKALKLLHSKSKDAADQLKKMHDEVVAKKKSELWDKMILEDGDSVGSSKGNKRDTHESKRERDKRTIDKIKAEVSDSSSQDAVPSKRPKLETPSPPISDTKSEKSYSKERSIKESDKFMESLGIKQEEKKKEKTKSRIISRRISSSTEEDDGEATEIDEEFDDKNKSTENFGLDLTDIACSVCKDFEVATGNQLVECQECHCLYHQDCHRPPVTEKDVNDPRFVWYCSKCSKHMKKLVQKPSKGSKSTPPPQVKEPPCKPVIKSEPSFTAFKRAEMSKPSKESSKPPFTALSGLASLAANLSGKSESKHSKSSSESTKLKSDGGIFAAALAGKPVSSGKKESPKARSDSGSGKSSTGLGSMSKSSSSASLSSKSDRVPKGDSFGAKLLAAGQVTLAKASSSKSLTKSSSSASLKSGSSSQSSSKTESTSSMMNADKRLQQMKKKAAAARMEKRSSYK